jgi:hypothetical protein
LPSAHRNENYDPPGPQVPEKDDDSATKEMNNGNAVEKPGVEPHFQHLSVAGDVHSLDDDFGFSVLGNTPSVLVSGISEEVDK